MGQFEKPKELRMASGLHTLASGISLSVVVVALLKQVLAGRCEKEVNQPGGKSDNGQNQPPDRDVLDAPEENINRPQAFQIGFQVGVARDIGTFSHAGFILSTALRTL
ncbi:MAG: hypothetical protein ABSH32_07185 [Bryobacteraceae bacterium]